VRPAWGAAGCGGGGIKDHADGGADGGGGGGGLQAGDNVGVLLRGIKREGVQRGQLLCKPGAVKPHKKFSAEIYCLTKEEGGRHTPFFSNYRPQVQPHCRPLSSSRYAAALQSDKISQHPPIVTPAVPRSSTGPPMPCGFGMTQLSPFVPTLTLTLQFP
jgi:hypothetical protein